MSAALERKTLTIAVAGNPNSGKSTLFNRLTGLRQKVANYAGVTVEYKEGDFVEGDLRATLVDLPGVYSLTPQSEEQRVATEVLLGRRAGATRPDAALVVIDSTTLERSLYLVLQLLEMRIPVAIFLNMADELRLRHGQIDTAHLERLLEMPILSGSAATGEGIADIKNLIARWNAKRPAPPEHPPVLPLPVLADAARRRTEAGKIARAVIRKDVDVHPWTDKIDAFVMHRVWGPIVFALVVVVVFQSIFKAAQPLMDGLDGFFSSAAKAISGAYPGNLAAAFLSDGVVAGVGSVVVFLPQILIVFFFLTVLEQSGYLARAALLMDRVMHKIGLQGKSFLPLISSYACAVPGIMATRTIENRRDRLATIFVAPFMTCSARLPVYALLIAAFVPNRPVLGHLLGLQAFTLLALYAVGFFAALFTARILKSSILQSDPMPFFMEVPPYRRPSFRLVGLVLWDRTKIFLRRAGTVILGVNIVLWLLVTFPRHEAKADLASSVAGRIGRVLEPVIQPLGFNWKIGVGLVSAQAAREVIISTLSTIYRAGEGDETSLRDALQKDLTPLSALSLMIFFALAMQCTSTLAVVRRETGSWKLPAAMFVYMNVLAYLAALLVFQGGRFLGLR